MAASSQVCDNKRARDKYWNGGLALPDAKRISSERLVYDSYLVALLEKIDNMDANPKEPIAVIQLKDERLNGVMEFAEDEVGLIRQAADVDGKGSTELGSMKQGELIDRYSEAISVSDTLGDMHSEGNLTYYDDVLAELGFFVENTAGELGIIRNHFDGDSMANMYSDPVYGYAEAPAVFYGSLWEDDLWQLNEPVVIQNGFESPRQEEFGISGEEFHDVWNDFRSI
uniref:Uncharacterized protein n=1 Tax=Picea sitchensis TaxID=3332 RepID=D5AAY9_PICSI|nr:unknown [Picea sitchensis]